MDKTQSKMIALSVLGLAASLFRGSKRAAFVIDVLTNLVLDKWDEGWDTYSKRVGPLPKAAKGDGADPFDALAECASE